MRKRERKFIDLTGQRFGLLLVIGESTPAKSHEARWKCVCVSCGRESLVGGWDIRNRTSCRCRKLSEVVRAFSVAMGRYKFRAKKMGKKFDLTSEQFAKIIQQPCVYHPEHTRSEIAYRGKKYLRVGLDRLNNDEGYVIGNVLPACSDCNVARMDKTFDEFLSWLATFGANAEGIRLRAKGEIGRQTG